MLSQQPVPAPDDELAGTPPSSANAPGLPPLRVMLNGEMRPETILSFERLVNHPMTVAGQAVVIDLLALSVRMSRPITILFLRALRRIAAGGSRITVIGPSPQLRRVLELCEIEGAEICPPAAVARTPNCPSARHAPHHLGARHA